MSPALDRLARSRAKLQRSPTDVRRAQAEDSILRGNKRLDGVLDFRRVRREADAPRHAARRGPAPDRGDLRGRRLLALPRRGRRPRARDARQRRLRARRAIGQVRLHIGEGMTGEAVEYLRPVTSEHAPEDRGLQALRGPRRGALSRLPRRPRPRQGRARSGALVIQRGDDDGLRGPRHRAARGARRDHRRRASVMRSSSTRSASAPHLAQGRRRHAQGHAAQGARSSAAARIGAIAALRRPAARPSESREDADVREDRKLLRGAFDVADKAIRALADRAQIAAARRAGRVPLDLRRDPRRRALPRARRRARRRRSGHPGRARIASRVK